MDVVRRFAPLAVVVAALALPAAAVAHANLVRLEPADGAVLSKSPAAVRVLFDDAVRPGPGSAAIRNGGGSVLARRPYVARGNPRELVVPLRQGLPHGDYSVRWSVVSDDGHNERGVTAFAIGAGAAPPTASLSAGGVGRGAPPRPAAGPRRPRARRESALVERARRRRPRRRRLGLARRSRRARARRAGRGEGARADGAHPALRRGGDPLLAARARGGARPRRDRAPPCVRRADRGLAGMEHELRPHPARQDGPPRRADAARLAEAPPARPAPPPGQPVQTRRAAAC